MQNNQLCTSAAQSATSLPSVAQRPFNQDGIENTCVAAGGRHNEQPQRVAAEDVELIALARRAIAEIFNVRYFGVQTNPAFRPTDLGFLPPEIRETEEQLIRETECRDRIKAALHMSLTSASVALEVAEALINSPGELSKSARAAAMTKLADDVMGASEAARHAALILVGDEPPDNEVFFAETTL